MCGLEIFLTIYFSINMFVGVFGSLALVTSESTFDYEKVLFSAKDFFGCVFMYQKFIWDNTDNLIVFGRVLLVLLASLLVISLNVIVFTVLNVYFIGFFIIACFNFVFGKEHKWFFVKELKQEWEEWEKFKSEILVRRCFSKYDWHPENYNYNSKNEEGED